MKPQSTTRTLTLALVAIAALSLQTARDANATLGGDAASIAADEHILAATRTVQSLATIERHDLVLPSNTVVHEYLSHGVVFAITWQGPAMPDLQTLFGRYFAQLSQAPRRGSHNSVRFVGNDFVMLAMGHGRVRSGRAWVPSLVPSAVNLDALD